MIEEHPFGYYLPEKATKLIIGSFPCFNGKDYGDWFYSGSGKNYFWQLLSDVFNVSVKNRIDKEKLCEINKIAITDIALKIRRKKGNCSDSNLEILEVNATSIYHCIYQGIKEVFFTSKFAEKHFKANFQNLEIQSTVLPSPSPAANMSIAGFNDEYKNLKESNSISSLYEFRLLKYKEVLNSHGN